MPFSRASRKPGFMAHNISRRLANGTAARRNGTAEKSHESSLYAPHQLARRECSSRLTSNVRGLTNPADDRQRSFREREGKTRLGVGGDFHPLSLGSKSCRDAA